jgi:hypothetical protein
MEGILKSELTYKKFKFTVPITKDYKDDGRLYLRGVASTQDKDYDGDQMLPEAIESMKTQATEGELTGFEGHSYSLKDIFGKIEAVEESKDNFIPIFKVRKSKEADIKELIEDKIKLGLSIGGVVLDSVTQKGVRLIKEVLLLEVSLTPIPANPFTLGTVSIDGESKSQKKGGCVGNICHQIFKSIDKKYSKALGYDLNSACYTYAMAQIKSGNFDSTEKWSFNDAKDGGELLGEETNVTRYAKAHLAVDKNKNLETKSAYHFPIGKFIGGQVIIFKSGINSAKRAASGTRSGVNQEAVANACDRLLAAIDKANKSRGEIMEDEQLKELIKGFDESVKKNNQEMVKAIFKEINKEPVKKEDETPTPEATKDVEIPDAKEIAEQVREILIKDLTGEPEPEPEDSPYDALVKGIAGDVLVEMRKSGTIKRKSSDEETQKFAQPTKKTQSVAEAAENLAKNVPVLNIAG